MSIEQRFAASSGFMLARLGAEARRLWTRMLGEHELTAAQFGVLMALDALGESYQQRLSGFVGIDPRNAVPVVDALRERGLVVRAPDPGDRRRQLLRLSPVGRGLVDRLREAGAGIEDELLNGLSTRDRAALNRLLGKLFESVYGGSE
jgi:DNA-binding MarR family transcriptional regulator